MVQMVIFVNLFIVPLIWFYIYNMLCEKGITFSPQKIVEYGIMVAVNIPAAKIAVFVVRAITNRSILIDSGIYTLLALATAVILADITVWFRNNYLTLIKTLTKEKEDLPKQEQPLPSSIDMK